jgi:hypothetical protein
MQPLFPRMLLFPTMPLFPTKRRFPTQPHFPRQSCCRWDRVRGPWFPKTRLHPRSGC